MKHLEIFERFEQPDKQPSVTREKRIAYILKYQDDIEWKYYEDNDDAAEHEYPQKEADIRKMNDAEITALWNEVKKYEKKEYDRYQKDTVRHGRAE